MSAADTLSLVTQFHHEKLAMFLRHQAAARLVNQYDFNNTYQYVINREDVQLSWLSQAVTDLGGAVERLPVEAERPVAGRGKDGVQAIFAEDAHEAQAFVDRWRGRVEAMTHARHRTMLQVILGETLEHKRFFEQALAGDTDLLGRRTAPNAAEGQVLTTRWVE